MSQERNKRIVTLYNSGLSALVVADEVGCSSATVYRVLDAEGVQRRATNSPDYARRGKDHPMWGRTHTSEARARIAAAQRGKPGDRWLTTDGYVMIRVPDHPNANEHGMVREHRLVMELKIGRLLLPSEVVHHVNGIKADNRPDNLDLFESNSDHSKHHASVGRKISVDVRLRMSAAQKRRWKAITRSQNTLVYVTGTE